MHSERFPHQSSTMSLSVSCLCLEFQPWLNQHRDQQHEHLPVGGMSADGQGHGHHWGQPPGPERHRVWRLSCLLETAHF